MGFNWFSDPEFEESSFDTHMSKFFSPRYLMRDDQGQGLMRHLTGFWISRSPSSQVHLVSALFDLLR